MTTPGWRSARGRSSGWAVPVPLRPVPAGAQEATAPRGWIPVSSGPMLDESWWGNPWTGMPWTLSMIAFMAYTMVIVTYALKIGTESMVVALLSLPLLNIRFRFPVWLVFLSLWVLWCFAGYPTSMNPEIVWDRCLDLGKLVLIAFVAVNVLTGHRELRWYTFFFLACFALYPLRGELFNYFFYHASTFGRASWNYIYANANDQAAFTLLPLSLTLGLLIREQDKKWRLANKVGVVLLPLAILMTQSRAGILGMVVFLALALGKKFQRIRTVLSVVGVALLVLIIAPSGVLDRMEGLKNVTNTEELGTVDAEGSAKQRYEIWKVAAFITANHPVTGVGAGTYKLNHEFFASLPIFDRIAKGKRDTHSTFLNVAAETGLVGLVLWLLAATSALWEADRVRRRCKPVVPKAADQLWYIEAAFIGYLVCAIWGTYAHLPFTVLHLAFMSSYAFAVNKEYEQAVALGVQPAVA
ncbi:MAG: O-antigen ligase family protein [Gemmatimonadetes bacterium]|nr:O-antigen ligase family protein [Gemmatimonadota bacterium]